MKRIWGRWIPKAKIGIVKCEFNPYIFGSFFTIFLHICEVYKKKVTMMKTPFTLILFGFVLFSCSLTKGGNVKPSEVENPWTIETLANRAIDHMDSTKWLEGMLEKDVDNYKKYPEVFQNFPLNKSPFPVADYEYAVSKVPFLVEHEKLVFKGLILGEYVDEDTEEVRNKLTLLVLTNDKEAEENSLAESRNAPYLTAEGYFKVSNNKLDWVFIASPDGFANLLLNMKLFDLRFGQTVVIFPQEDRSFRYVQLRDAVDNYSDLELFKKAILTNNRVVQQLGAEGNIKN